MDITLGNDGEEASTSWNEPSNEPTSGIKAFLKEYLAAKIIIMIDTHCLNNGTFVYWDNTLMTYAACYLPEASINSHSLIVTAADSHPDA